MDTQSTTYSAVTEEKAGPNLIDFLYQARQYKYLYLVSFILFSTAAYIYLRYTPSIYGVQSTILIKEDKTKLGAEGFIDGLELLASSKNVQNELEIVRSYQNIKKTIQSLNYEVSYFIKGNIKTGEIYNSSPFTVQLDSSFIQSYYVPLHVKILSDSTYIIYPNNKESTYKQDNQTCKFGVPCQTNLYSLTLYKSESFAESRLEDDDYYFIINDIEKLTLQYISRLKIGLIDKKSSILLLSLNGQLPKKEGAFLDKLCEIYIQNGLEEKNQIAVNTIRFIDDQLGEISDSLKGAEKRLEKFRSSEKMMDLSISAEKAFDQFEALKKEQAELLVKSRYYDYLLEYVSSAQSPYDLKKIIAPSALGIEDALLNKLISELHGLNSEKTSLGFSAKEMNPSSNIIDLKIENTKKTLVENLKNIIHASQIAVQDNKNRLNEVQKLIDKLPANERNLVSIQRRFLLNENIYNYLMQKRIEAAIAKAANTPDNKVVNKSMLYGNNPVSPQKSIIILLALFLGLLLPSIWVYAATSLNDTITSKDMIERNTNLPIIGSIAHYGGINLLPIIFAPKSGLSESIRSLRVNLKYLAAAKQNKIIGVTSSISGEGKTFFSANLAASIATSGSKVIILGADLRKPKLNKIIEVNNTVGLSNYFINQATIKDIIQKTTIPNLDIISSGPIPPNPTELLESTQLEELMTYLKMQYEYIIIDAPPVGLVADYYLLSKYMDADLFLIRQNYTKKALLKEIHTLYKNKKLNNLFIVFNDVVNSSAYGYNYSYHGYYEETVQPGFLKKLLNKIKSTLIDTK